MRYLETSSFNKIFEQKSEYELNIIREAALIVSEIIKKTKSLIKVGMSTKDLDDIICNQIRYYNCKPAFLNYRGYPACSCISIDHELVHGIPKKEKKIKRGSIISIDLGIIYNGFYADAATTVLINSPTQLSNINNIKLIEVWKLLQITYNSMMQTIPMINASKRVGDIGSSIQQYVENSGYSVIRDYVGHAIGRQLHEKPDIPNYGVKDQGEKLIENMVLCLEPMVSMGDYKTKVLNDGWTVVMDDKSLCSHFEHMVLVKNNCSELLTSDEVIKPQIIYD